MKKEPHLTFGQCQRFNIYQSFWVYDPQLNSTIFIFQIKKMKWKEGEKNHWMSSFTQVINTSENHYLNVLCVCDAPRKHIIHNNLWFLLQDS